MIDNLKREELRKHLVQMGNELGFDVVTPYILNCNSKNLECFAFLPKFGSSKGMILNIIFAPEFKISKEILDACKELDIYCSHINYDSYIKADKKVFCEALLDWGYFGEPENKPDCFF